MVNNFQYWIDKLNMQPHPEGGFYKETFRSHLSINAGWGQRNVLTSIFYLLQGDNFSAFHRIKSDELWYHHAGGTLLIHEINEHGSLTTHCLSATNPFAAIAPGSWFASEVKDKTGFVLVSCAVAPGFDFADFELADASTLSDLFPEHTALIATLTR
jgi:predicted cupin superfamily sugar epimerase